MPLLFPIYNPNDAPAITAVLATLLAGGVPPRVDVSRVHDTDGSEEPWLDREPYPGGRLLIRGKCRAGVGETTGHISWYCCARFGRAVPVREYLEAWGVGPTQDYDASFREFSCSSGTAGGANSPYDLNTPGDGWRQAYDDAYAALA